MAEDSNTTIDVTAVAAMKDYYQFFDAVTNRGVVLNDDLSAVAVRTVSRSEKTARNNYATTISELCDYYSTPGHEHPKAITKEDVLSQRIVATSLVPSFVSSRGRFTESRASRMYPPKIFQWDAFSDLVDIYSIGGNADRRLLPFFLNSLERATNQCSNEGEEQSKLIDNLHQTLVRSGIVHRIETTFEPGGVLVQGKIDFALLKDEKKVSMICETKTTQNLTLPMTAALCVSRYEAAYNEMETHRIRTTQWTNIAHPLGQLLGYLVDNSCRFGALTSGTRTYFCCIANDADTSEDGNTGKKVMITDAWYVGQHNYLRAWAYVYSLGCDTFDDDEWDPPRDLVQSTSDVRSPNMWKKENNDAADRNTKAPANKRPRRSPRGGRNGGKGGTTTASTSVESCYPLLRKQREHLLFVAIDKIEIIDVIGAGRNGCCFKVNWNGQMYAMKQFDIVRDGDTYFKKELRAYLELKAAWGILVPRPIFWSESKSGGRLFLGLQLGREPTADDDTSQFKNVLTRLQKEYGIRHNDAEGRNMIYISDADGVERIAAIDFEDWDRVPTSDPLGRKVSVRNC
jgi:hypothetical protein